MGHGDVGAGAVHPGVWRSWGNSFLFLCFKGTVAVTSPSAVFYTGWQFEELLLCTAFLSKLHLVLPPK